MWAQVDGEHVAGAAKRRRERRHRAYLKYARMSVAVALSEYKHHTSRGQRMDRAGVWERAALHGHVPEHPTPGGRHWVLFSGRRRCACRRPQEQVQRHTVDQFVDAVLRLPALDVSVPLMVEQLADVLSLIAQYEKEMARIEDLILVGSPVSNADREAWRLWVNNSSSSSGARRKKKKRRKRKLPKAGSASSWTRWLPLLCNDKFLGRQSRKLWRLRSSALLGSDCAENVWKCCRCSTCVLVDVAAVIQRCLPQLQFIDKVWKL